VRRQFLSAAVLAAAGAVPAGAAEGVKVVYHMSAGNEQAAFGLGNVANHLDAEPGARIVVVGLGPGIEFMLREARDPHGNLFFSTISELQGRGVEFRACNNTLSRRHIAASELVSGVKVVPSGIAELARLQAHEGYAYLKP
jgi:intracellular sulfur oxidation DsrE/DsrF family protein